MKRKIVAGLSALICGILLGSCNPLALPLPQGAVDAPGIQHVPYTGSFSYSVDAGAGPGDVYFVFTNPSLSHNSNPSPEVSGSIIEVDGITLPAPSPQPLFSENSNPGTIRERIDEFSRNPAIYKSTRSAFLRPQYDIATRLANTDTVGDTDTFYKDIASTAPYAGIGPVPATCRFTREDVNLGDGRTRSLSIWVETSNWDAGDTSQTLMTDSKIQAIADKFLASPASSNDIYHWDTATVGEPWDDTLAAPGSDFISWDTSCTITILLCDLNSSYPADSYVLGYFYPKDNYTTAVIQGSNQRIMFYLDATVYGMLSGSEATWSTANYWPRHMISTLAHEFQHMIQFYQKDILFNSGDYGADAWINEMCSMVMEDLVADKLGIDGPRGVAADDPTAGASGNRNGRIPEFNYYTFVPLAIASNFNSTVYYAVTYSFGAWLARNYGGAGLVRRIVRSAATDASAITDAILAETGKQETLASLLDKWSASVLVSDSASAPLGYRCNTGSWITSSAGGVSYNLGSINFFNYYQEGTNDLGPYAITETSSLPTGAPYYSTNLYFKAAEGLIGSRTWNVTLPAGILMSVVVKR
jgi:hypothetical protein